MVTFLMGRGVKRIPSNPWVCPFLTNTPYTHKGSILAFKKLAVIVPTTLSPPALPKMYNVDASKREKGKEDSNIHSLHTNRQIAVMVSFNQHESSVLEIIALIL